MQLHRCRGRRARHRQIPGQCAMTGFGRNTGVRSRGWFHIRLGCAAAVLAGALVLGAMTLVSRCGPARTARRAAVAMALLTGLAAVIFRLTWGTREYGLSERVLLGLGMGWISALAIRAFIASAPNAAAG